MNGGADGGVNLESLSAFLLENSAVGSSGNLQLLQRDGDGDPGSINIAGMPASSSETHVGSCVLIDLSM